MSNKEFHPKLYVKCEDCKKDIEEYDDCYGHGYFDSDGFTAKEIYCDNCYEKKWRGG